MAERSKLIDKEKEVDPLEEYERFLRIDKHDLDTALMEQPDLYYRVSKQYAFALSRRDQAKHDLEAVEAEADQAVREDAQREGEKISEAVVKGRVVLDKEYTAARRKLILCAADVARWEAMKNSYEQRSYALKELSNLYASGYFADVAGSKPRREAAERDHTKARDNLDRARREAGRT